MMMSLTKQVLGKNLRGFEDKACADREWDHVKAKDVLSSVKPIFDKHDLPVFLLYGTCLGAVRSGEFIPYDSDIDMGIYEEDVPKLVKMLPDLKAVGANLWFICPHNGSIKLVKNKIELCFAIIKKTKNPISRLLGYKWQTLFAPFKEDFFSKKKIESTSFIGYEFRVPSPKVTYIETLYGLDWKVPQEHRHAEFRPFLSRLSNIFSIRKSKQPSKFSGNGW
jgi:hypothetical protein